MQLKHARGPNPPARKILLLKQKDAAEYERTRSEIIKVLDKMGGYVPAVDDIFVAQIATTAIYMKNIDFFADSDLATSDTYASVTDTKLKMAKMIENAIRQLALSRRDRIGNQTEASFMKQLKEELERTVMKNGEQ
jgi:hypothetical protein